MSIIHLDSVSQLNGILSKSKDKLSVIDFHATWCGPCHAIAPTFEAFSKQYKNVNFLKCDVDAAKDVAMQYRISAMPTFLFLKGDTQVDQVRGANRAALEDALKKHSSGSSSSTTTFSGRGQTLGGGPAPPDVVGDVQAGVNGLLGPFNNLSPQFKVLIYLLGGYILFWYLS